MPTPLDLSWLATTLVATGYWQLLLYTTLLASSYWTIQTRSSALIGQSWLLRRFVYDLTISLSLSEGGWDWLVYT